MHLNESHVFGWVTGSALIKEPGPRQRPETRGERQPQLEMNAWKNAKTCACSQILFRLVRSMRRASSMTVSCVCLCVAYGQSNSNGSVRRAKVVVSHESTGERKFGEGVDTKRRSDGKRETFESADGWKGITRLLFPRQRKKCFWPIRTENRTTFWIWRNTIDESSKAHQTNEMQKKKKE